MNNFTTMARLISHLGDQLISNTTVAILELIKNAYDATIASGKKNGYVKIEINQKYQTMIIEDNGHGMTKDDINNKYLVIGTVDRLEKKEKIKIDNQDGYNNEKVPQGEKGLGRFATMKLGEKIVLLTKSNKSKKGCLLGVNWNQFGYSCRKKLEDVNVHLFDIDESLLQENGYKGSFTKIKIYNLKDFCDNDLWTPKKFEEFYKMNFMKYLNPFKPTDGFQIKLEITTRKDEFYRFYPENLDKKLLNQAPYQISGNIDGKKVEFNYYIRGEDLKEHKGIYEEELPEMSISDFDEDGYVGPLNFQMYFYTRTGNRLKEIKGYENVKEVRRLLDQYCGGLMIYRDNFRVLPYATKGNDWLELDSSEKLRGKGLRFYTIRTVGAVFIDTLNNPNLRDQTNREGLIANKAYENLRRLLKATIKTFLNIHEQYYPNDYRNKQKETITTQSIHNAVKPFEESFYLIDKDIKLIDEFYMTVNEEHRNNIVSLKKNFTKLEDEFSKIQDTIKDLDEKIIKMDEQQRMIIDLAGIGITAETVAHEMWSYIGRMTQYLHELKRIFPSQRNIIDTMIHNTKALEAAISRLDIQTITKRRTKSRLNLFEVVRNICESKFSIWRAEDSAEISLVWECQEKCYIKANQGMLVQIFDNLLNNSRYWLLKQNKDFPQIRMEIHISISEEGIVELWDTGPGILKIDSEAIFEPFFTRKKEGEGRGLGLYIIQEILNFHNSDIKLSDEENKFGKLYKFIIDFSKCITE